MQSAFDWVTFCNLNVGAFVGLALQFNRLWHLGRSIAHGQWLQIFKEVMKLYSEHP